MSEQLKPCPFCGGEAEFERKGDRRQSTIVSCLNCGASLENGEEWDHGTGWNTRALPQGPVGWRDGPDWKGFGQALVEDWPTADIDGSFLFDMALKHKVIREIPGGYDPDQHIDAEGICPERGDPWYEYVPECAPGQPEQPSVAEAARSPIEELLPDAIAAAEKAMAKFPQPNYVISKWAEETGEVTKELIHFAEDRADIRDLRGEIVQSLAMLHRLMVEGDQVHGMKPLAPAIRSLTQEAE